MRVCYFGTYDRDYIRNRVIIKGLRANGVEVVECHIPLWRDFADKMERARGGLFDLNFLRRLVGAYCALIRRYLQIGEYDVMMVSYPGQFDLFVARALATLARKPVIFDPLVSLYDTIVGDRKLLEESSWLARLIYLADKYAFRLSDLVLLDTGTNIEHFRHKFGVEAHRFRRVFVGADDAHFKPLSRREEEGCFKVIYFGTYIPLHGVEHVIRAAKALEGHRDIWFEFVGTGQLYPAMRALAEELAVRNIAWLERWLVPADLALRIAEADICLGVFGTSEKASSIIPSKVFVGLAMGKAVLTGDSPAAREALVHGENAFLCEMGSPQAIAASLLRLRNDEPLRQRIAENGYRLFRSRFSPMAIGETVKGYLAELL